MRRLIIGYLPANLVSAATAVIMVVVYTRLLTPVVFGTYTFGLTATFVAQASLFYGINLGILRFYPAAARDGGLDRLLHTLYLSLVVLLGGVLGAGAILACVWSAHATAIVALVCLLALRAIVSANQAVNRAANRVVRFTIVECSQAMIGLGVGVLLVMWRGPTASNAVFGLLIGSALALTLDLRQFTTPLLHGRFDAALLRSSWRYTAPLSVAYLLGCSLQFLDRLVVGSVAGTRVLGIYAVATALAERPPGLISGWITTATFPAAVQALERGGVAAGRRQAGENGTVLLSLLVPACLGIMLTSHHVAGLLVGGEFREGAAQVLPVVAAAALLRNVAAHIVDHSFHMSRRTDHLLLCYGLAAAANLLLDLVLVPRYGMYGAAVGSLVSLLMLIGLGVSLSRRNFPLWLPLGQVMRILASSAVMASVLVWLPVGPDSDGLAALVAAGVASYGLTAFALDLAGARGLLSAQLRRRVTVGVGAPR